MNRRAFFKSTATPLSLAVAGSLAPLAAPVLARERGQAKIAQVEAFAVPKAIYAKVTDDAGNTGWGECGHDGGALVAGVVKQYLRPELIGGDVFDTEPLWAKQFHEIDEIGPGGLASQAMAGVDAALWDLRGKLLGVPVYKLIGGKFRSKFPIYGSFSRSKGRGKYRTPEECARYAEDLMEDGFQAIKLRLGIREENQDPADDPALPCAKAVRNVIGDDVPLYVDANNGYSPARAIQIGRALIDECNVSVFEEPVAQYQYGSLAKVAEALPMFIAGGEHEYTKWAFRDLILHGKVTLLTPDVSKLAGITEAKKVAALAEVFDLPMSVHNARPTLLTAAHWHYVASCQSAHRPQEHPGNKRHSHLWKYFENKITVSDGYGYVSEEPGLGLIVNEAAIRRDQLGV
ncbi:mandelate racemase/muconate lactonizing enzyme family protein [Exilibacterium tricleocarpae]|uniref:Mandelate racemase/muconate lactonizing enzyme family protein n=1 Tax=Exilibacterium tricleocarpae TaxID=2591008 RepID=A0A545TLM3_9GAMM|nr:mandelate racemase/muconate lactonizing enzyme family protein [Exilibacterium tricleocarpae]TQV78133.1 mandelate racemase/muconate lactonizing enzyme family protein [Exilibacterium tricleocarpae]